MGLFEFNEQKYFKKTNLVFIWSNTHTYCYKFFEINSYKLNISVKYYGVVTLIENESVNFKSLRDQITKSKGN